MKTRIAVAGTIAVAVAVCSWLALQAVAAPPQPRPGPTPRRGGGTTVEVVKRPDLVVRKVQLEQKLGGPTPPFQVIVWVKNIGTAEAAVSTTAVMSTTNVQATANAVEVVGALATPAIAVGGTASVNVTVQGALSSDRKAGAVAVYTEGGACAAGGLSGRGALVWERTRGRVEIVVSRRNVKAERLEVSVPLPLKAPSVGRLVSCTPEGSTIRLDVPGGYIVEERFTASVAD